MPSTENKDYLFLLFGQLEFPMYVPTIYPTSAFPF